VALNITALFRGALAVLLGYVTWVLLATTLFKAVGGEGVGTLRPVITGVGILVPVLAGAYSAKLATSRPQVHGALAASLGAAIVLIGQVLITSGAANASGFLGWLVGAGLLGWLGAILAPVVFRNKKL
jgi:hypothetical protein